VMKITRRNCLLTWWLFRTFLTSPLNLMLFFVQLLSGNYY